MEHRPAGLARPDPRRPRGPHGSQRGEWITDSRFPARAPTYYYQLFFFLRKNKGGDLFFTCISIGVLYFCWSCTFVASKRHKSRSRKTNSKPTCQHVIYRRLELDRFSDSVYGHLNSLPKKKRPFGTTVLHAQGAATEAAPATGREMEVAAR